MRVPSEYPSQVVCVIYLSLSLAVQFFQQLFQDVGRRQDGVCEDFSLSLLLITLSSSSWYQLLKLDKKAPLGNVDLSGGLVWYWSKPTSNSLSVCTVVLLCSWSVSLSH